MPLKPPPIMDVKQAPASVQTWYRQIQDSFTDQNHNDLANIQGGSSTERYHMTLAEDTLVATLAAGTYTPTLTNVTNLTSSTAYECQYLRVGATVTVSGKVDVDATAAAATELGISLPIASNFGANEDCSGTACWVAVQESAAIRADTSNDRAAMVWLAADTTAGRAVHFTFTYQVI